MKLSAGGVVIVFFLSLYAFTKLVGPIPFSINSVTTQKSDFFTVTGVGKATVTPDIAVITVGVTAQSSTVKLAQKELNTKIDAITKGIKQLGVDAKDIQTSNYSIHPRYDYQSSVQRIIGYDAQSSLTIKVRDMDKTNNVIDSSTANGANQVGGVSFDVDDRSKAENEARILAVADAKNKAEIVAKTAGFSLGKIVNYSEGNNAVLRPIMYTKSMPVAAEWDQAVASAIEPGSNEISMQVSLSYELR
ncbi:MAG: SIMPL domain-containing protein [Patescibacteria group bacterium]